MNVLDLGRIRYAEALDLQMRAVDDVGQGGEEVLFLLEHEPVVTLGRSKSAARLHADPETLRRLGVELAVARRGGDVTCHFPGQLVAYPIFRLERRPGGVRRFFHDLEETFLRLLAHFDIPAGRAPGRPGVWTRGRKIASIGVGVRRWVSFHGVACNVADDLSLFSLMDPCGLEGVTMTSIDIERQQRAAAAGLAATPAAMNEVKRVCAQCFREVFSTAPVAQDQAAP